MSERKGRLRVLFLGERIFDSEGVRGGGYDHLRGLRSVIVVTFDIDDVVDLVHTG